jgi:hypothetical protein
MKNNPNIDKLLFATFAFITLSALIIQLFEASNRQLTGVDNLWFSMVVLVFSTASCWFFSKLYSRKSDYIETIQSLIKLLEGSERIGLISIEPQLRHGTTSIKAIKKINLGLDFLGIGGGKFISKIFDEKTDAGKFVAKNDLLTIRFLLLDPKSPLIEKWIDDKEKAEKVREGIKKSLSILAMQIRKGRIIQVRLYDFAPPMRIQIIDNRYAYICEYDPISDGWDAPQLCFTNTGDKPLIHSLILLYENFWVRSKPFVIDEY